ncbi:insulin-like [Daktulosphaira vitifoliae]|uniref:insulin-like n=1 Tax=Daktulosphaira vitifoliae TaxID=58002 RepID=UPI0021A9C9E6|nr:insulin-like [Daktulosphaira vitifoliae]
MKIYWCLNLFSMVLIFKIVSGSIRVQRSPQQYCGSQLADIMKVVCRGIYNEKRNQMENDAEFWDYKELEDYNAIDYPFRSKREAMSFMPLSRSLRAAKKSKIIEECCYKPCWISELKGYCQN